MTARRIVGGLLYGGLCIGGFLLCLAVLGIVFVLVGVIMRWVVDGLQLDPEGTAAELLGTGVPAVLGLISAGQTLEPLGRWFDRLERWKAQSAPQALE